MVFCIISDHNDIKMGLLNLPPLCLCSSGLNTLYQGEAELNKLLKLVLTEGDYEKHNFNITGTLTICGEYI